MISRALSRVQTLSMNITSALNELLSLLTPLFNRTTLVGPNNNDLTYMLAWESLADREKKWNAFFSDPEWVQARAESEKDGPINAQVASSFLTPTKFSAIQ